MDYDLLETEIVGVLNTYFGSHLIGVEPGEFLGSVFVARAMPEDQTELLHNYDKGVVNVQYADSTYGSTRATDRVIQEEQVMVVLYVQCDKMKGATGGYRLLKAIKKALLGYKPEEAITKMSISAYGDWRIEDGEMRPYLEFTFKTINQQEVENPNYETIDSEGQLTEGGPLGDVS